MDHTAADSQIQSHSPHLSDIPSESLRKVLQHITGTWSTLTRSHRHIVEAAKDGKVNRKGQKWPVYVSEQEDLDEIEKKIKSVIPAEQFAQIEVIQLSFFFLIRNFPVRHQVNRKQLLTLAQLNEKGDGLLYLPHKYVVPGGRFNEMYNWLLREGLIELAKGMVENHLYQIEHYGTILNANRSYYLFRSQPPFLSPMVKELFEVTKDKVWLKKQMPLLEKFYAYWTSSPHLIDIDDLNLSRYFAIGEGPAREVIASELDTEGRNHYERVREFYGSHPDSVDYGYDINLYYDSKSQTLTPLFYKGDRTMREAGCDPSCRFGMFNVDVIHYLPVCLNSLLYKMEMDMSFFCKALDMDLTEQMKWLERAKKRKEKINTILWDDEKGLYFDYNFITKKKRMYEYATVFFPLWAGVASSEQAKRIVDNLSIFEKNGGIVTSTKVTGCQWDAPFGWAPYQLIANQGLHRYGYHAEANRLAVKFLSMVTKLFEKQNKIVEKYDVCSNSDEVEQIIKYGYVDNEIGFGWTNAVFLELLYSLQESSPTLSHQAAETKTSN